MSCAPPRGAATAATDLPRNDHNIVVSSAAAGDGWQCRVEVDHRYSFQVDVSAAELLRYAPSVADPKDLVERSFRFLLEREPPSSILKSFSLLTIERYFPEYAAEIRRRQPPAD